MAILQGVRQVPPSRRRWPLPDHPTHHTSKRHSAWSSRAGRAVFSAFLSAEAGNLWAHGGYIDGIAMMRP
jgi:hypothetical protein